MISKEFTKTSILLLKNFINKNIQPNQEVTMKSATKINKMAASFILAFSLFTQSLLAVPANEKVRVFEQPDGTKIYIEVRGDERFHWIETVKGEVVIKGSNGFFEYATVQTTPQGKMYMIPSGVIYDSDATPALAAQKQGHSSFTPVSRGQISNMARQSQNKYRTKGVPYPKKPLAVLPTPPPEN